MKLRPYQIDAIDQIRAHYAAGTKRVILHLAGGAGKTVIFSQILKTTFERKKKGIMVVQGVKLVSQASARLKRENVPHGVIQAGCTNLGASIQVCSISTLYRRKFAPPADLIVIDECHLALSDGFKWLLAQYPEAFLLSVSATPHVKGGMRPLGDAVVYPIGIQDLMDQGYLVKPKYYAPSKPDLSGVAIQNGDYVTTQLSDAMNKPNIFGDLVTSYRKFELPTLLFCVDVKHSKAMTELFNREGISAVHIDANTPHHERDKAIRKLEAGSIKIISSIGTMTTGVDIPAVRCVMLARPTKSYNLYVQIVCRGTRPYEGKDNFVVLDHANLLAAHGMIENERECQLDADPVIKLEPIITCEECYFVWPKVAGPICPGCGWCKVESEREKKERKIDLDASYVMQEVTDETGVFVQERIAFAKERGYKPGWVYHKIKDKYGVDVARRYWRRIEKEIPDSDYIMGSKNAG